MPADDRPRRPGPDSPWRSVLHRLGQPNIRQTLTVVVLAVLLAVGAWFSGAANGKWQSSVREEVVWSAAAVEILRHVYGDEAPWALEIALAQERGAAVAAAAHGVGQPGQRAMVEGLVDTKWAAQLRTAHAPQAHLVNDEYWRDGSGFDVSARIVDLQSASADLLGRRPDRLLRAGDRDSVVAELVVGAAVPLVAGYILVELLLRRRRRARGANEPDDEQTARDVGLVPSPWAAPRRHRLLSGAALAAWVLLGVLPLAQLHAEHVSARASTQSSRAAVQVATGIGGGSQLASFRLTARRDLELGTEQRLLLREWVAGEASGDVAAAEQLAVGAHHDALPVMAATTSAMVAAPAVSAGVDVRLAEVAASGPAEWRHLSQEQLRLLDVADDAGRSASTLALALLMSALALSLSALAMTPTGERSALVTTSPLALLGVAAVLTVVGLAR